MKITEISIENFRLLENITINLDEITTAIVGKNNSGKTSFSEIFSLFFSANSFEFEDFSINSHKGFEETYRIYNEINNENKEEIINKVMKIIPKIKLLMTIEYDEKDTWNNIKPFLISLKNKNQIQIMMEYSPKDTDKFLENLKGNINTQKNKINEEIKKIFKIHYRTIIKPYSEAESTEPLDLSDVKNLIQCHFIEAQRDLESNSNNKKSTKLSTVFQEQYDYKRKKDENISDKLIEATGKANDDIEKKLNIFFSDFIKSFQQFGFPGIKNEKLELQSNIELDSLFKNNVRLVYNHFSNKMPEKYNGLGYKNLMYIISKILSFEIINKDSKADLNLLFIEEPEAHMHPQMQTVFIKNINKFLSERGFNVQVIITTHSSHILTNANFESIRYFNKENYCTEVKDLKYFNENIQDKEAAKFLKQYLTLDKGDLFFSDKAILFEGVVERILMPLFIKKLEEKNKKVKLSEQYISYLEIGGAYMNKFNELLDFLSIPTLIITDIDACEKITKSDKKGKEDISLNGKTLDVLNIESAVGSDFESLVNNLEIA